MTGKRFLLTPNIICREAIRLIKDRDAHRLPPSGKTAFSFPGESLRLSLDDFDGLLLPALRSNAQWEHEANKPNWGLCRQDGTWLYARFTSNADGEHWSLWWGGDDDRSALSFDILQRLREIDELEVDKEWESRVATMRQGVDKQ